MTDGFLDTVRRRHTDTLWLSPDPDLVAAAEEAERAARRGKALSGDTDGPDPDAARQAALDSALRLDLKAMPRTVWQALKDTHQPSKSQRAEAAEHGLVLAFDADTFVPAAIAATLTAARNPEGVTLTFDPPSLADDGTVVIDEQALTLGEQLCGDLTEGEGLRVWAAVNELNVGQSEQTKIASFGNGSRTTRSGARRAD